MAEGKRGKSVIVMTYGLAGSSVLAGLLCREAGYWPGDRTWKKKDYDTHENAELIELNRRIFAETGYDGNYKMVYSREAVDDIARRWPDVDHEPYRRFVRKCDEHRPWIWKDPRLWLTIRCWKDLIDLENTRFLILTREPFQLWVGTTLRRQIHTYRYCKKYADDVVESIRDFIDGNSLDHLHLVYEDLLCEPEKTLERLNGFLGCDMTIENLKRVYRKPLHKRPRGVGDFLKASLIYLKNYRERYR